MKREIRHFHVVVVQKREQKCTKKRDARAKLCFAYKTFFLRSRCRPRRWIFKSLLSQLNSRLLLVKLSVVMSFCRS